MNDPFAIDWAYATRGLAFADEYMYSCFDVAGNCSISVNMPIIGRNIYGQEFWDLGNYAAGTFITIDMTNLDWRNSLRRRS